MLVVASLVIFQMNARHEVIGSVAVLAFENAAVDTAIDYVSDGISQSLIITLASHAGRHGAIRSRSGQPAFIDTPAHPEYPCSDSSNRDTLTCGNSRGKPVEMDPIGGANRGRFTSSRPPDANVRRE